MPRTVFGRINWRRENFRFGNEVEIAATFLSTGMLLTIAMIITVTVIPLTGLCNLFHLLVKVKKLQSQHVIVSTVCGICCGSLKMADYRITLLQIHNVT